ncbi:hypothetical protein JXR93_09790 [bacterium]|nr:hypothetical protein [bacterium]
MKFYILLFLIGHSLYIFSKEATVILKNNSSIKGTIISEQSDIVEIQSDFGKVIINRENISSIHYKDIEGNKTTQQQNIKTFNQSDIYQKADNIKKEEHIILFYKTGEILNCKLIAKTETVIIVETDSGVLTIEKKSIKKIEYVTNSEFTENGNYILITLNDGKKYEGVINYEDFNEIVIETTLGKLALPKSKLASIEYISKKTDLKKEEAQQNSSEDIEKNKESENSVQTKTEVNDTKTDKNDTKIGQNDTKDENKTEKKVVNSTNKNSLTDIMDDSEHRKLFPRYDIIDLNYAINFGPNFGPGFGVGYHNKFIISQFRGLDFSAVGGLSFTYFRLYDDITNKYPSIEGNYKGGAFATTLSVGGQMNIYPSPTSFYDFYVIPMLELHYIYDKIEEKYPSFPQYNSTETNNEIRFGLGIRFGIEFSISSFVLGIQYNIHYLFGRDGFNQFSLTFLKPFF